MLRSVPLATGFLLASTTTTLATANCQTQGQSFRVEQSDGVTYEAIVQ